MNPVDFGGQRFQVKVTIEKNGKKHFEHKTIKLCSVF